MYYPELTAYSYSKFPEKLKQRYEIADDIVFYNVGWLDYHYDYPAGFVGDEFLNAFQEHIKNSSNMFRGFHRCEFCYYERLRNHGENDPNLDYTMVEIAGESYHLGCHEIAVFGDNCVYICPDMIFHYMKDHAYRPPADFCEAVLPGVELPGLSSEQQKLNNLPHQRKPCYYCSEKEAIMDQLRPLVSEMRVLLHTLGDSISENELASIVPDYTDILARLERVNRQNINLIDQCPEICSRREVYSLFDEIGARFSKSYTVLASKEVTAPTIWRIYAVLNESVGKTWG